jgi:hypothetical protein
MKMTGRSAVAACGALYVALLALDGVANARPPWVKKVKEMGLPAENCLYCHTVKLPKKESFKPEELNERGKWLVSEKNRRNAKEVDLEWLKEYKGGPDGK